MANLCIPLCIINFSHLVFIFFFFSGQRSRSRSPQLFPDAQRDAQRTPEIVQGLDELMAEVEGRMPRVLGQPPSTYNAAMIVAEEHSQRVARITPPEAPPSPPAPEQPTISCLVCFDSIGTIQKSSRTLCSTVCGHVFCSTCIDAVVRQKKQCPVCRKKLTKKQYHPLFIWGPQHLCHELMIELRVYSKYAPGPPWPGISRRRTKRNQVAFSK